MYSPVSIIAIVVSYFLTWLIFNLIDIKISVKFFITASAILGLVAFFISEWFMSMFINAVRDIDNVEVIESDKDNDEIRFVKKVKENNFVDELEEPKKGGKVLQILFVANIHACRQEEIKSLNMC